MYACDTAIFICEGVMSLQLTRSWNVVILGLHEFLYSVMEFSVLAVAIAPLWSGCDKYSYCSEHYWKLFQRYVRPGRPV